MNTLIVDIFIKNLGITLCICFIYFKAINFKTLTKAKIVFTLLFSIITSISFTLLKPYFSNALLITLFLILCCIFLSLTTKYKFNNSIIATIISASISYIIFMINSFLILGIFTFLHINEHNPILFIIIVTLQLFFTYNIFKIKRYKNGFPFLYTPNYSHHIDIFILIISIIVIISYFLFGNYEDLTLNNVFLSFACLIILIFLIIKTGFNLFQSQKLLYTTLKDYESQLAETQQKLTTALAEKQTLIKSNHEFYHRQEAIKKKLEDLSKQYAINYNTEFAQELGNLSDRINKLSDEYAIKTNFTPTLVKCNIEEIDDMLSYMKSECDNNNIEFILKIDCDINYIIDNFISKSQLETLLGDLIRNSIIAVNHNSGDYKSIMLIFGIKDSIYELCILDSGIPFEVNTLINLGLSPASTHIDEGGTGIGFLTTFETLNSCNASITINENTKNNYSKSIEIQFDNQNEYRLITNRKDKILENNVNNREIKIIE